LVAVAFDLESVLRRDRLVVVIALVAVIVLSWVYVLAGAGMGMSAFEMTRMTQPVGVIDSTQPSVQGMSMGGTAVGGTMVTGAWTVGYAVVIFFMWWVMMFGMMLPSAAPLLLLFARMMRKEKDKGAPYVPTGVFALGYVIMWAAFSAIATGAQWGLEASGLLSGIMVGTSAVLGAGLLIAAGVWQLTPWKNACLRHCRSPIGFLSAHWRPGRTGAFKMGLVHGAFCLGCCWFLMALLFYGGVMNLYWIIGLALYILIEKLLPAGARIGQLTGVILIAWGATLLFYA
jgi:predicted metal-binding membrane protein